MNFDNITHIDIPEGHVRQVAVGGTVLWKAYDAEVEYIEGDSSQYIELNFVPDNLTGIAMKYLPQTTANLYYIGLRETSGNTRFGLGHTETRFYAGWGNVYYGTRNITVDRVNPTTLYLNFYNDRLFRSAAQSQSMPSLPFTPTSKMNVMRRGGYGTPSAVAGRVYWLQITQDSQLVFDFIPVRKGSVGFLYDRVSGLLFSSDTSTNFTPGPDV